MKRHLPWLGASAVMLLWCWFLAAQSSEYTLQDDGIYALRDNGVRFQVTPAWQIVPGKALNNQCPVCGTMAEPWNQPMRDEYNGFPHNCQSKGDGYLVICDPPHMIPYGPTQHMIRCRRCNAAFWQDSQEPK